MRGAYLPAPQKSRREELINFYDFAYIAGYVIFACVVFFVLSQKGE